VLGGKQTLVCSRTVHSSTVRANLKSPEKSMTLIVAKIKDDKIKIVSDSKITDEAAVRNNPLFGNLKTLILNPDTCIGFAGNVYFAEIVLNEFYQGKFKNFQELFNRCGHLHHESNFETDFILATLFENKPVIYKISESKIFVDHTNLWIGHIDGFNKYQSEFHDKKNKDRSEFQRMGIAFSEVIKDEKISGISDFQIGIETVYHEELKSLIFIYEFKAEFNFANQKVSVPGGKQFTPMKVGGAQIGGYGICYLRSVNVYQPGVAIHFPQGGFGMLFCPKLNHNKAIIIKEKDGEDFAKKVWDLHNIALEGIVLKDGFAFKYIVNKN
jgi:hypothetical protein